MEQTRVLLVQAGLQTEKITASQIALMIRRIPIFKICTDCQASAGGYIGGNSCYSSCSEDTDAPYSQQGMANTCTACQGPGDYIDGNQCTSQCPPGDYETAGNACMSCSGQYGAQAACTCSSGQVAMAGNCVIDVEMNQIPAPLTNCEVFENIGPINLGVSCYCSGKEVDVDLNATQGFAGAGTSNIYLQTENDQALFFQALSSQC
jgi:hypothetical protein